MPPPPDNPMLTAACHCGLLVNQQRELVCVNSKHKSFFRLAVPWVVSWLAEHAHLACAFVRRIFVSASLNSTLRLLDEPAQLPGCQAASLQR